MKLSLSDAAKELSSGHVVAVPTETVYGLAASLRFPEAIEQIYRLKNRPSDNPLIVHLAAADQIHEYISYEPEYLHELIHAFWPGPLTLILPIEPLTLPKIVRAGLPTAGFRVPSLRLTQDLIRLTGPLVMPSANLSGRPSATSPDHVEADFGSSFPVLDGGLCEQGVESTILGYSTEEERWHILRLGAIPAVSFTSILKYEPSYAAFQGGKCLSPGQKYKHYSPKATLHFLTQGPPDGPIIGFSDRDYSPYPVFAYWGTSDDPVGVAQKLYAILRSLDEKGIAEAWLDVNFPHDVGLWETIWERIQKAAN